MTTFLLTSSSAEAGQVMNLLRMKLRRFCRSARGQAMIEYAIIVVLMAVVILVALMVLGNQTKNVFSNISGAISSIRLRD